MKHDEPKLFIYIPTYNRPKVLRQQLDLLIPQLMNHPDRVRLLVNDNCSPGGVNDSLSDEYQAQNIEFRQNPGNIGPNANPPLGFIFARPDEFLWILSDNDLVSPSAVNRILGAMEQGIDLILIDIFSQYKNESELFNLNFGVRWDSLLPIIQCISATVYNMRAMSPYIEKAFSLINSCYPHVAAILAAINDRQTLKTKFVPGSDVLAYSTAQTDGDYTQAVVGYYLLSSLMPKPLAKAFCWRFFVRHGYYLYRYRHIHQLTFLQSRALLRQLGLRFRIGLPCCRLIETVISSLPVVKKTATQSRIALNCWKWITKNLEGQF